VIPLKDNIPTRRLPVVTIAIIAANILVFFVAEHARVGLGGAQIDQGKVIEYGLIPFRITHPGSVCALAGQALSCGRAEAVPSAGQTSIFAPLTVFSSMFMHGGLVHLLGNMLFLWIFGNNVEDSMGRVRFVLFYLLGGVVAIGAQIAVGPDSMGPTIGASGAVAAVLGGYALLYPRARVVTLVFIIFFITLIELPALVVLGAWFVLQLLSSSSELSQPASAGVAYFAHVGGFVFGLTLIRLFANRRRSDYSIADRVPVY
jgi:membrane associated rhomboid family serine protease